MKKTEDPLSHHIEADEKKKDRDTDRGEGFVLLVAIGMGFIDGA
jgi:hypothetical protein